MVNVGDVVPFWVTAETLRPTLQLVLPGVPLLPRVVTRSKIDPTLYYIAFAGPSKGPGLLPVANTDTGLTGLFLVVDASSPRPIVRLTAMSETWTPTQMAQYLGLDNHEIITWDDQY